MPHLRRQLFVLVPLLGWTALPAPAAAQDTKTGGDAISATRRDLEALKSDRNLPVDSSKVALPTIDAPPIAAPTALDPAMPLPPTAQPLPGQGPTRRSNSWLIDAMEGNSGEKTTSLQQLMLGTDGARDKTGRAISDSRSRLGLSGVEKDSVLGAGSGARRDGQTKAGDKSDLAPLKDAAPAPNPLAGYMAAWMTSRDFNLLAKPDMNGAPSLPGGGAGPTGPGPGEAFTPSPAFFSAAIGGPVDLGPAKGGGPAGVSENPYLQALTLPAPTPGPAVPPMLAPPSSPAFPAVLPPLDSPPPPMRTEVAHPELQKRDDDAKYFPQLKRF